METFKQAVKRLSKNKKSSHFYGYIDPKSKDDDKKIETLREFTKFRNKAVEWEDYVGHNNKPMQRKTVMRVIIEWRLPKGVNQKEFDGWNGGNSPHWKKEDAVCGLVYIRESNEYRVKPKTLIEKVIDQIDYDFGIEDLTSLEELLSYVPKDKLKGYLSEID